MFSAVAIERGRGGGAAKSESLVLASYISVDLWGNKVFFTFGIGLCVEGE